MVTNVALNGQAHNLGVRAGWIILEINGKAHSNNTQKMLRSIQPTSQAEKLTLILFLERKTKSVLFQSPNFGMKYTGYTITDIEPEGEAHKKGVHIGWIILAVNGETNPTKIDELLAIIQKSKLTEQITTILFLEVVNPTFLNYDDKV